VQRIVPEHNAIILLNYVMNDMQPYQLEPEGTSEEDSASDSLKEIRIVEETSRSTGNTDWCLCELCEPMDSEKISLCCYSVQNLSCILADSNVKCVSQHPEWLRC